PGGESRRFPVVFFKLDVVLAQVNADGAERFQIKLLNIFRRRLQDHLQLHVFVETVGIVAVAAIGRTARGLDVCDLIRLGPQHAQKCFRSHGTGADFHIIRLLQHASPVSPELFEGENQLLVRGGGGVRHELINLTEVRNSQLATWNSTAKARPKSMTRLAIRRSLLSRDAFLQHLKSVAPAWVATRGQGMMERKNMSTLLIAGLTAVALFVCYLLFRPYLTPILFASVIAIVFYPLHRLVQRTFRNSSGAAIISTLVTLLLTVVPVTLLLLALSNELSGLYQALSVRSADAGGIMAYLIRGAEGVASWASKHFPIPPMDLRGVLLNRLESTSASLLHFGASLVSNLLSFGINAAIALVVLFFLFRDGESAVSKFMAALPLYQQRAYELRSRISSTRMANVYGSLAVGALQGTLTGLAFRALGLGSPALWGVATGVL